MATNNSDIFRILTVSPSLIQVEVLDAEKFKQDTSDFTIGSYLKISDDSNTAIIALVQSFKIKETNLIGETSNVTTPTFILDSQPIGFLDDQGKFRRGGQQIAIPPNNVEIADEELLKSIYSSIEEDKQFCFSTLAQNSQIDISIDGDKFFSKHIAVVGSTGSGKSGTVARILQEGIKANEEQIRKGILNNTHILLFDLHGEYAKAFPKSKKLNVSNLVLPYWLMNSEELEEMFIESRESNSHNQVSLFKTAVTLNKKRHNSTLPKVNYDTPVYFSIDEVFRYISNQNVATKDAKTGELKIKVKAAGVNDEYQLFEEIQFEEKSSGKINGGPYANEFDRFVPRLETKINDDRLSFLLKPRKADFITEYKTEELSEILKQFIGFEDDSNENITIIDLSGIPFEVLSIVVSLISRLVFDFCFYYKNLKKDSEEIPFLLVLEEAHNYIPQSEGAKYHSVKKSIERIAKEGRKYGLSLMIVSQRPSEISETIFSQCNNFVAMRLTNPSDQQYVKRLMPDSISAITDTLPVLERQEALIIGDCIPIPTIVRIKDLTDKPDSNDINFRTEWKKDWINIAFEDLIKKLKKES
ncbi:ATP-binding protein [Flavobacterium sp. F-380]|uniref:ATP-binding protein n=1 Tax=Flavobacterium kayseriense TaxID=2764714 RepID=A0ABR7J9N9_9FLAO|nr:ATP-binding protein [Flavobacterium kayseriense]MBC5842181.1 ATP-binding protein [Flavobacterium kayseriense]MBC5848711.1 ATP-binding protein [Flavobacterium kayseriense]